MHEIISSNVKNTSINVLIVLTHKCPGHTGVSAHSFKLFLNDSPLCPRHNEETICDIDHLMFVCPSLRDLRICLKEVLRNLDIPYNVPSIFSTQHPCAVHAILNFFKEVNFKI